MVKICIVPGCKNPGRHSVPKDLNKRSVWMKAMRLEELELKKKILSVCPLHFKDSDYFTDYGVDPTCKKRRDLRSDAVPSIFSWNPVTSPKKLEFIDLQDSLHKSDTESEKENLDPMDPIADPTNSSSNLTSTPSTMNQSPSQTSDFEENYLFVPFNPAGIKRTYSNLSMKSILVTGGAGYVGSHTVAELLSTHGDEYKVIVIDNMANAYRADGVKKPEPLRVVEGFTGKTTVFYDVDIKDKEGLSEIFEHNNIECVIHFAALKAVGESVEKPLEYYQTNVSGTCTLFEVMRAYGVYKLIYSSSCTVYGEPKYLPLNEAHPTGLNLSSPYARSKHFCEQLMMDLCTSDQKWKIISLRYFNPVGAHPSGLIGEDPSGVPNNLMPYISQVAVGRLEQLMVFGTDYPTVDGTGVRDYIHVMDLAEGHIKAIKLFSQPGFAGFHAINLGTGTGYSVLQMIKAFETASGRTVPYRLVGRRAGDIAENYADVTLALKLLGWRSTRTLDDMCRDTWRWQTAHPQGFKKQ